MNRHGDRGNTQAERVLAPALPVPEIVLIRQELLEMKAKMEKILSILDFNSDVVADEYKSALIAAYNGQRQPLKNFLIKSGGKVPDITL